MPADVLVASPGDLLTRHLDDSGWPLLAPTLLTIHRTSALDEMSRQIVYRLDGDRLGEHVHFTVWNKAWGGYYVMMLFLGSAPLRLGVARGEPDAITASSVPRASRVLQVAHDGSRSRGDR